MTKLKKLEIVFEGDCDRFNQGETLRGKVVLDLDQTICVKGIRVTCKGKAEVTIFVGDYDTQKETYFSNEIYVFGTSRKEEGDPQDMAPGHYEYPFSFDLPFGLPESFVASGDEHACVVYKVEVSIQRPGKFSFTEERTFHIRSVLDLNILPDAIQEAVSNNEKTLSCLCMKNGTISAVFRVERKGYVPGELMPLYGFITNSSKSRVKRSEVTLIQYVTLKVQGSTKRKRNNICKCRRGPIAPGQTDQWQGETLEIPDIPPSYLTGCGLIDIQYVVQLSVVPAGLASRLHVPLDVIIGTVPLRSEAQLLQHMEARPSLIYDFGSFV